MAYRKLGRTSAHRKSMLRNLTTDLIVNGRIVTTETRAKEVRKFAAFMMNVIADVKEEEDKVVVQTALQKLFDDVAPRFENRNGGYTRIIKMDARRGDAAKMAVLELVD